MIIRIAVGLQVHGALHALHDGSVQRVRRSDLQRFLLSASEPLRLVLDLGKWNGFGKSGDLAYG